MRMTVEFHNGLRGEALVLATNGNRIRVIVAGRGTTEQWQLVNGHCFDELGRVVGLEAMVAVDGIDYVQLGELYPKAATAGGFSGSVS